MMLCDHKYNNNRGGQQIITTNKTTTVSWLQQQANHIIYSRIVVVCSKSHKSKQLHNQNKN